MGGALLELAIVLGLLGFFGFGYMFSVGVAWSAIQKYNRKNDTKFDIGSAFFWWAWLPMVSGYKAIEAGHAMGTQLFTQDLDPAHALTSGKEEAVGVKLGAMDTAQS